MTDRLPPTRPASDRFPVDGTHERRVDQRIPTLAHLLPAWYPKDLFIGEYYAQQMGDNTLYHDEASNRHAEINAQNNASRLHNFGYKTEAPHERHTPSNVPLKGGADAPAPLSPTPDEIRDYPGYEFPELNTRGQIPTGSAGYVPQSEDLHG